jgi:hypothetical protein
LELSLSHISITSRAVALSASCASLNDRSTSVCHQRSKHIALLHEKTMPTM